MRSPAIYKSRVPESDTLVSLDVDSLDAPTSPASQECSVLDTVLELFEDTSISKQVLRVHPELPTFAEQSYTDHRIDLAPANKELAKRERSLRAAGDWNALAQLLIERAELTHSEVEAGRLLVQAAEIYELHMANPGSAQAIVFKALELDPGNADAVSMIETFAQRSGNWLTLIESFKRAAEGLADDEPAKAGELWIRLACAYAMGRNDLARAFATLANVRSGIASRVQPYLDALEPTIERTQDLDTMLAVSHRVGDQARSARLLSRAIAMSQSVVERSNYHHLIAVIELNRDENAAAEWHWQEALRLDPRRQDVREALGALYQEQGEYRKAVSLLEEARAVAMDGQARARYAVEAAYIYREQFGENTRAVDLCAVALQFEPGHHQASMPVVQRYYEQKRWAELGPVLESLLVNGGARRRSKAQRLELYSIAAECAYALSDFENARHYYDECLELSPENLDAVLGCARSSVALGDAANAITDIEFAVELHKRQGHSATRMAQSLSISADAHRMLGKLDRAIELYEFCAAKGHAAAMASLAEIYAEQGQHREAVAMRLRYSEGLSVDRRVQILCDVSEVLASKLGDVEAAIDACWEALCLDAASRPALHRLAVLFTTSEQWREAIKIILRMAELETSSVRRARYLQAAGTIACQDGQWLEAVALLNKAIDTYFFDTVLSSQEAIRQTCLASFRRILGVLEATEDWRAMEQNYRRMICRLEPGDPEVVGLWTELGHIYREKLGEDDAAIDSFEVACSLDASRLTNHRILIDLYEGAGADKLERAIARRRLLLEKEPLNAEHYKALRGLYVRTRQMDRVFCVCRALDFMDAADDRERAFYRRSLQESVTWASRPMNSEMRSRLRDSQVDPDVSRIFGLVAEVVAQERALTPGQVRLSETQDPQFDHLRQLFSATSYALGMPTFDCFVQPQQEEAVRLYNLRRGSRLEPTFVLGSNLFAGRPVQHIVYGLARSMFSGRRSYYLRLLLDEPADLAAAFYAGVTLVRPDVPVPAGVGSRLSAYRGALAKSLHPSWIKKLGQAVDSYLLRSDGPLDLYAWLDGVDATARHAGLLLCADLKVAASALGEEAGMHGERKAHFTSRLVLDSISEAHMSLREDLGLAIVQE